MDCNFIVCKCESDKSFTPVTSPISCSASDFDVISDALFNAGFVVVNLPKINEK